MIGTVATRRFLQEYEQHVPITSRADVFRELQLNLEELSPEVREGIEQAIEVTRDYLGLFV